MLSLIMTKQMSAGSARKLGEGAFAWLPPTLMAWEWQQDPGTALSALTAQEPSLLAQLCGL